MANAARLNKATEDYHKIVFVQDAIWKSSDALGIYNALMDHRDMLVDKHAIGALAVELINYMQFGMHDDRRTPLPAGSHPLHDYRFPSCSLVSTRHFETIDDMLRAIRTFNQSFSPLWCGHESFYWEYMLSNLICRAAAEVPCYAHVMRDPDTPAGNTRASTAARNALL